MRWLAALPKTWCSLWRNWYEVDDLPLGYNLYVLSYHMESPDTDWISSQCQKISAPIILLTDCEYYDFPAPKNLHCYTWIRWHEQARQILTWFPVRPEKKIIYKTSAVCNRLERHKMVMISALAEKIGRDDGLFILRDWLEDKNKHLPPTNNVLVDSYYDIFWQKYYKQIWTIDDWDNEKNTQSITGNPWTPIYQQAAMHFTNESYSHSFKVVEGQGFITPGPFLTEKTIKCLVGGTAFLPVGQFDTYRRLGDLGCRFDYGIDLDFDRDPHDSTRLEKLIRLIDILAGMTAADIYESTRISTLHNQDLVISGYFSRACDDNNSKVREEILERFSS